LSYWPILSCPPPALKQQEAVAGKLTQKSGDENATARTPYIVDVKRLAI